MRKEMFIHNYKLYSTPASNFYVLLLYCTEKRDNDSTFIYIIDYNASVTFSFYLFVKLFNIYGLFDNVFRKFSYHKIFSEFFLFMNLSKSVSLFTCVLVEVILSISESLRPIKAIASCSFLIFLN